MISNITNDEIKAAKVMRENFIAHPEDYFVNVLGVDRQNIWPKMQEMINAVRDYKKVVIKAGHSVSKTYTMSRLAMWFLYCFYPSTVITTAPSHPQVEEILWREIRNAHAGAKLTLGGVVTKTKIDLQNETGQKWFAYGFATKPDTVTKEATRMQGFHNDNVLVIFDEAAGVVREIWNAAMSLLSSGNAKFVAVGNPTSPVGEFIECFKDPAFHKVTISVKDTPNFIQGREVIVGLSGREYEQDVRDKFGENSNYYKARVSGEIPDEDPDSLIPISWIEAAEARDIQPIKSYIKRFITVDVGDGGDDHDVNVGQKEQDHDETVIKAWENKLEIDELILKNKKIEDCEPYVWRMLRKINGNCIIVDGDGIGRVMVKLLSASKDAKTKIISFQGSSKLVYNKDDFETRYSEGHWQMRLDFESGLIGISKNPDQRQEISAVRLVNHPRGYITIEKKKYLKKRLGRSPGNKDAIMMMSAEYDNVPIIRRNQGWASYKNNDQHQNTSAMAA